MAIATLKIPLDEETAQIYTSASAEDKQKIRLLVSMWLREFNKPSTPLKTIMDKMSEKARKKGLTPEILEGILKVKD